MLPHPGESGSIVTMRRRWRLLAMASGCGSVIAPEPDAGGDEFGTLRDGCAVMLRMDEPSWGLLAARPARG